MYSIFLGRWSDKYLCWQILPRFDVSDCDNWRFFILSDGILWDVEYCSTWEDPHLASLLIWHCSSSPQESQSMRVCLFLLKLRNFSHCWGRFWPNTLTSWESAECLSLSAFLIDTSLKKLKICDEMNLFRVMGTG